MGTKGGFTGKSATVAFPVRRKISWLTEGLLASQEMLCSVYYVVINLFQICCQYMYTVY